MKRLLRKSFLLWYDYRMQAYLEFAKRLAKEAGRIMDENFVLGVTTEYKADDTPLTIADTSINKLVIDEVKKRFPDHGVLGEEASFDTDRPLLWVVDPLDGTMAYSQGLPNSVFSLALVEKGETIIAVVSDPFTDRLYWATKNGGAFVNGTELHVSDQHELGPKTYIDIAAHFMLKDFDALKTMALLAGKGVKVTKSFTAISNALPVATGQHAASLVFLEHPWDGAAVSLIVAEAGGKVTDLAGNVRLWNKPGDGFVVSNGLVHDELIAIIRQSTQ